jgi:hypothetical protein
MKDKKEYEEGKKRCEHFWEVNKVGHILPNGSILDCSLKCGGCGKEATGVIHISGEVEDE